MAKYDLESAVDDVLALMQAYLPAKIAEIEVEKTSIGKGLTPALATIASTSYYRQSWSEKILQTNPSIYYGVEEVTAVSGGSEVAELVKIFVEVIYIDSGQTNDASSRIARYARAIKEVFTEHYGDIKSVGNTKIETIRPISFRLELDSSEEVKVGGVSITIGIA